MTIGAPPDTTVSRKCAQQAGRNRAGLLQCWLSRSSAPISRLGS